MNFLTIGPSMSAMAWGSLDQAFSASFRAPFFDAAAGSSRLPEGE
jgi:hypothetical protein